MKKSKIFFIIFFLLVAFILRFYKIDQVPPSLYYDELDYGYQARSLVETGRDYRGKLSPFYVHSFNDIRAPIPAYLTAVSTLLFSQKELAVRMPSVISGVAIVLLVYLLIGLWTGNFTTAFLTSLVFATNPWQIQYSRFSHEVTPMLALYLLALWLFFKAIKFKNFKYLIVSVVLFSLDVYTYRTMSLFIPLTFFVLFLIYRRELFFYGIKKLILLISISATFILPFLYFTTILAPDIPRINQLAITSDPQVPIWVIRNREVDSGNIQNPTIGQAATATSFFYHNKIFSWLDSFTNNYFQSFSMEFLLIKGDLNLRHSIPQMGQIFFIDLLALIFGLFSIGNRLNLKENQWLLLWLLIAPIPAALTSDGAKHASRLFIFSAPLLIIIGIGWAQILQTFKTFRFSKLIFSSALIIWLLLFIFYLHNYFVHYPLLSSRSFGYGFKQAMLKINQEEAKYQHINMVATKDPPMIYYLFWSNTPPKLLQVSDKKLDKYQVISWSTTPNDPQVANYLKSNTLYLVTQSELSADLREPKNIPDGIKLIDLILYPDKEIAFYLISKDPNFKD